MGPRAGTIAASPSVSAPTRSRSNRDLRSAHRGPTPSQNGATFPNPSHNAIYQTQVPQGYMSHPASPGGTVSSTRSSRMPSPSSSVRHGNSDLTSNASATTLLPSFLQDLVHSSPLRQSNLPSIHSSPSTSTSSWSLDEYDHDYEYTSTRDSFGLRPQYPIYDQPSSSINPLPRNSPGPRSVDANASIYGAASTSVVGDDVQKRDIGVIGIGRPARLGSTIGAYNPSSSGSVASTPSVDSIWKIDSEESRNGRWTSSAAFGVSAGAGPGVHRSKSYQSTTNLHAIDLNTDNSPGLEGYGRRLEGLERLAARLTIGSNGSTSASSPSGRNESGLVSAA
jgi:hypothetical protein